MRSFWNNLVYGEKNIIYSTTRDSPFGFNLVYDDKKSLCSQYTFDRSELVLGTLLELG